MNLKSLFTNDDAVSPVIGVILMVAITVILAAVIGAFVLDLGSGQEKSPTASFDFDQYDDAGTTKVDITVQSGESIDGTLLETKTGSGSLAGSGWSAYTEVGAGDQVTVEGPSSGDTLSVVWTSESGDTSSTLAEYDVQ